MTSPTSSGQPDSSPPCVESRVDAACVALDAFEQSMGLPGGLPAAAGNEATRLLTLHPAELSKMTAEACGEGAFTLLQYAFYLQRCVNVEQSRVRMAEAAMKRAVSPLLGSQKGYSMEERTLAALDKSDPGREAQRVMMKSQLKLDRVSFLASRVEALAKALGSLRYSKGVQQ